MIELKKISQTISKAYDINPKFAEDMTRTIEQYAEYYFKISLKEWTPKDKKKK
jgi:GTP cyclohydrolase FolE2